MHTNSPWKDVMPHLNDEQQREAKHLAQMIDCDSALLNSVITRNAEDLHEKATKHIAEIRAKTIKLIVLLERNDTCQSQQ